MPAFKANTRHRHFPERIQFRRWYNQRGVVSICQKRGPPIGQWNVLDEEDSRPPESKTRTPHPFSFSVLRACLPLPPLCLPVCLVETKKAEPVSPKVGLYSRPILTAPDGGLYEDTYKVQHLCYCAVLISAEVHVMISR